MEVEDLLGLAGVEGRGAGDGVKLLVKLGLTSIRVYWGI